MDALVATTRFPRQTLRDSNEFARRVLRLELFSDPGIGSNSAWHASPLIRSNVPSHFQCSPQASEGGACSNKQ